MIYPIELNSTEYIISRSMKNLCSEIDNSGNKLSSNSIYYNLFINAKYEKYIIDCEIEMYEYIPTLGYTLKPLETITYKSVLPINIINQIEIIDKKIILNFRNKKDLVKFKLIA